MTGAEIAEVIVLPPALEQAWHARGYYGSVSHNVKAIYQRYMGWYDGNPASLWPHPPVETAKRYVECLGGTDATVTRARTYADRGDLRFAAQLLNHAVYADPGHPGARQLLATVYDQLGRGAENATWRNAYLTGAAELRGGILASPIASLGAGMVAALTAEQLLDSLAIRLNGPRAWEHRFTIDWHIDETDEHYRMRLDNGTLTHWPYFGSDADADATYVVTRAQFLALLSGQAADGADVLGDPDLLPRLFSLLDNPEPDFPIVTP
jgi:alkyl sulfatase BDS1-like metallo-beta-lactamase superfamily hydrolase